VTTWTAAAMRNHGLLSQGRLMTRLQRVVDQVIQFTGVSLTSVGC